MAKTRRVPKAPTPPTLRRDGQWENIATGMGVMGRDKRLGATFVPSLLTQETCQDIWRGDDIAARIIETIPNEMLREDFGIKVAEDHELSEELDEAHRELNTVEALRSALQYARAFGGAGILLGADDGAKGPGLAKPLNEDRIASFDWMTVYSPRELQAVSYYSDMLQPRFGEIETYRLAPLNYPPGAQGSFPIIHESRIVRIGGAETLKQAALTNIQPGWEDSILVRVAQVINDFQAGWQGSSILLTDFATPTLRIKGLARALAGTNKDEQSITQRARMLELCRSIARVSIVDADGEEYKRETTTVTGLADMLDKLALRLAAGVDMPVSLLMGQSPAGLQATGDADIRWFYDKVKALQKRKLKPAVNRITRIMMLSKDGPCGGVEPKNWIAEFPELWQLTEKEQVEAHFIQAQADALYITNQVVTPEEIAKSRFGGDEYSTRTVIDMELREKMAAEADQQQERLQPTPVVDPNVAAKLAGQPPAPGAVPPEKGKPEKKARNK